MRILRLFLFAIHTLAALATITCFFNMANMARLASFTQEEEVRVVLLYIATIVVLIGYVTSWFFMSVKSISIRASYFVGYVGVLCLTTILAVTLGYMYQFDELIPKWLAAYKYRTDIPGFILIPTITTLALVVFWYPNALASDERDRKKKELAEKNSASSNH